MTAKKEYISTAQMNGYYLDVVQAMSSAQYRPDQIVALSRGGLDFGVKLSHWYDDAEFVPLIWQTRHGAHRDIEQLNRVLSKYSGCNILIVDDICDSGKTLSEIEQHINTVGTNAHIDYAVAIHNQDADFGPSWCGRTIHRNIDTQWFVFPWEEWWRSN